MTPFWGSFFNHLKGCGRSATLFMVSLAGLFALLLFGAMLFSVIGPDDLERFLLPALSAIGLLAGLWLTASVRRAWLQKRQRLNLSQLSSDELSKARSKLMQDRNRRNV